MIAEISFDLDSALASKPQNTHLIEQPVFVSGLARSGTSALINCLEQTGLFRSLSYSDMPFILMPNIWKLLSSQGKKSDLKLKERAHLDGIMVGFDSPEAFEEVFWRVFCGMKYIQGDRLLPHKVTDAISSKFKLYVRNILTSSGSSSPKRYLSKNNCNVLRLSAIAGIFPDSHIIIPFRDPLQQAISLLNQHKHFCKIQKEDKFTLDYMNWLGHFEFGLGQKSFHLKDDLAFDAMKSQSKTSINFWLLNWKNYYRYVADNHPSNSIFFSYEKFCREPSEVLNNLYKSLNIECRVEDLIPFIQADKKIDGIDLLLLKECNSLYREIDERFLKVLK